MIQKFSKSETVKGSFKGISIHEGIFLDDETGETIDLVQKLTNLFGGEDVVFDLSATLKTDEELDI